MCYNFSDDVFDWFHTHSLRISFCKIKMNWYKNVIYPLSSQMKKIITILLLIFFIWGNFSFAQSSASCTCIDWVSSDCPNVNWNQFDVWSSPCTCKFGNDIMSCTDTSIENCDNMCDKPEDCVSNDGGNSYFCKSNDPISTGASSTTSCLSSPCPLPQICDTAVVSPTYGQCIANNTTPTTTADPWTDQTINGITIGRKCLLNGQCKFNIYDALGIRESVRTKWDPTDPGIFVQDIILAATSFIWTVVVIAIIVSGLMRIFAWASGKDPSKAKEWLINSLIGLLIVVSSYLIIRLVQYIAKWF